MKLFNRSDNPEEKWHKRAIFVNFGKTRIVLVDTTEAKPACKPLMIPKIDPRLFVIEELLSQEQYGLLDFLHQSINTRQTDGNLKDSGLISVQGARTEWKNLNLDLLLPQNTLPFPIISRRLL